MLGIGLLSVPLLLQSKPSYKVDRAVSFVILINVQNNRQSQTTSLSASQLKTCEVVIHVQDSLMQFYEEK